MFIWRLIVGIERQSEIAIDQHAECFVIEMHFLQRVLIGSKGRHPSHLLGRVLDSSVAHYRTILSPLRFNLSQDPGNLTSGSLETIFLTKGGAILWRPILCREGALLIFVVQSPTPAFTVGFLCCEASYCAPANIDM